MNILLLLYCTSFMRACATCYCDYQYHSLAPTFRCNCTGTLDKTYIDTYKLQNTDNNFGVQ